MHDIGEIVFADPQALGVVGDQSRRSLWWRMAGSQA
ncbi:hypothetical protein HD597_008604 [Nonomuraea thailandensis]|uniref:Uncharacterized protein n=1 Tax=Nonomuraea thailandensis TaxID=1188745 RepID=A0A9X2K6K9_9ACTN|nr:hypothetical protein [Nonomuraea thailandensis]